MRTINLKKWATSLFAVLLLASGAVFAGEIADGDTRYKPELFDPSAREIEILDRIDAAYPADTSTTIDDPRLLESNIRDSTTIVDRVDTLYPVDTSATVDDPYLLEPSLRGGEIVDRVDTEFPVHVSPVVVE